MSLPSSLTPLFSTGSSAAAAGYQVSRSLRFNSADSAFLSRTPAVAGNRTKWTWAGWVKRSGLGANNYLLEAGASDTAPARFLVRFSSDDTLLVSRGQNSDRITSQVFRDVSAWCHLVIAIDTTQGTPNDRIKIYFNGTQVTTFSSTSNPGQNDNLGINAAAAHAIGRSNIDGVYFNGYLADIWFLDGITPSTTVVNGVTQLTQLGEFDATTGVWNPKAWDGAALTGNSFHLDFADNSALTSGSNAGIGKDTSGLGNYWNTSGLSVTAGAGNDSLVDSPTNYGADTSGVGGVVRGNYATLNPLTAGFGGTLSNGNLDYNLGSGNKRAEGTIAVTSGKWYWEGYAVSGTRNGSVGGRFGFTVTSSLNDPEKTPFQLIFHASNGLYRADSSGSFTLISSGSYTDGDLLGCGLDADSNIGYFYKNGSLIFTFNFSSYVAVGSAFLTPYSWNASSGTPVWEYNFGQRPFAYQTPGTNRPAATFLALCTQNLPSPLIAKPNTLMDVVTYTGNGSTQSIAGLAFSPDFAWFKRRDSANNHALFDIVRGSGKFLISSDTGGEGTDSNSLISFDTSGFTIGQSVSAPSFNITSGSYVAWSWDAGTSTVSNPDGSITSQVRANVSAGFSVVTYTGDLSGSGTSTVGHGLGVAPKMIIFKRRDGTSDWPVQHSGLPSANNLLYLNSTASTSTSGYGTIVAPTSTVFTVAWLTGMGVSGQTHVAYCFAPVVGYSSFGSYTGNGSADGPFVYTGMRTRWLMVKRTDVSDSWYIYDTARNPYNVSNLALYAQSSLAEQTETANIFDVCSNGFKVRGAGGGSNVNGGTYIYMALAENPFQYSRAR